jgi:IMP dehydrogenase
VALARHADGQPSSFTLNVPFTSAIMQAVSWPELAISLARSGGLAFLSHNQGIEDQAAAVRQVKTFKAGFVESDTNVRPTDTLGDLLRIMAATGHSTAAVTHDGTSRGHLAGLITSRDFHPDRHDKSTPVADRMVPVADLACGPAAMTLPEANTRLWEERLDCLPLVDPDGGLAYLVFRSDYADHKRFVDGEAFTFLADAGADFVKVGIGGGSISAGRGFRADLPGEHRVRHHPRINGSHRGLIGLGSDYARHASHPD